MSRRSTLVLVGPLIILLLLIISKNSNVIDAKMPIYTKSESSSAQFINVKLSSPDEEQGRIELIDERTRNSKTYDNGDLTKTVIVSSYSQNFMKEGQWESIDTSLTIDQEDIQFLSNERKNSFDVRMHKQRPEVHYSLGADSVIYRPIISKEENFVTEFDGKWINYFTVWDHTTLRYSLFNDFLKMELLLANDNAPKEFLFSLEVSGVTPLLNRDNSISFVRSSGETSFIIPPMWVQDAKKDQKYYDKTALTLSKAEDNKYTLSINLFSEGLEYPLIIDPTTTVYSVYSTYINKIYVNTPDIPVSQIESVLFRNDTLETAGYTTINHPMNIYLSTDPSIVDNGFYLCCELEPGHDGLSATKVGNTTGFDYGNQKIISKNTLKKHFSDHEIITGGAFWVSNIPSVETETYGSIEITYEDSNAQLPSIVFGPSGWFNNQQFIEWKHSGNVSINRYVVEIINQSGNVIYKSDPLYDLLNHQSLNETFLIPISLDPGENWIKINAWGNNESFYSSHYKLINYYPQYKYIYDEGGRLIEVKLNPSGETVLRYIYDNNGNLIRVKKENPLALH